MKAELFDGRSHLLVKPFMFHPGADAGCLSRSLTADHFDAAMPHLNSRDVTLISVPCAPLEKINAYKRRMGSRLGHRPRPDQPRLAIASDGTW
ncbi:DUF899 family protein [Nonomuraea fuscirosea]|uniref:DUF899 family protein n=1 Tax=Nonomuraea fuscirosea TaxID=1291556 RepID=UPI001C634E5C|nr:DUF899 family protein [Nonomuraea fuscirosea]